MLKINVLLSSFFLLFGYNVVAQISGISGTKISSFSYNPVPHKTVEFEPTLSSIFAKAYWADTGERKDFDNDQFVVSSNIYWRISYGLNKRTELGLSATNNLSSINLGAKVWLINNEKTNFSAMFGYNIPLGNDTYAGDDYKHISFSNIGYGVIASFEFDAKNQLDVNFQIQHGFNDLNPAQLFINTDFGSYFLRDDLFVIFGVSYQQSIAGNINSNKLTIYPGLALETGKQFAFAVNSQHDLFGRNSFKTWGLNIVLTTVIF